VLSVGQVCCVDSALCVATLTVGNWHAISQIICKYLYINGCIKCADLRYPEKIAIVVLQAALSVPTLHCVQLLVRDRLLFIGVIMNDYRFTSLLHAWNQTDTVTCTATVL
jgi:hypothetical protein